MASWLWLGHAPAKKQIRKITLSGAVRSGDDLQLTINGKSIVAEAPFDSDTADALLGVAEAAWSASEIPEFGEITPSYTAVSETNANASLTLEGEDGVPFDLSCANLYPSADVDLVTTGGPGQNAKFSFYFTGTGTGGSFFVAWDVLGTGTQYSTSIAYTGHTADTVKAAIVAGMSGVDPDDITVTGSGTVSDKYIIECVDELGEQAIDPPTILTSGIAGGGTATVTTIRNGESLPPKATGVIQLRGSDYTTLGNRWHFVVNGPWGSEYVTFESGMSNTDIANAIGHGAVVYGPFASSSGSDVDFVYTFDYGIEANLAYNGFSYTGGGSGSGIGSGEQLYTSGAGAPQAVYLLQIPTSAEFTLQHAAEVTGSLFDTSPAEDYETELAALTPNFSVAAYKLGAGGPTPFGVVLVFSAVDTPSLSLNDISGTSAIEELVDATPSGVTEIQQFYTNGIGGSFTLNGNTVSIPASTSTVQAAMGGSSVVSVTGSGTPDDPFEMTWVSGGNQTQVTIGTTNIATGAVTATVATVQEGEGPVARQWTVTKSGVTGGTWVFEYSGYKTGDLAYNISAADLQTALQALGSVGSGNMTVSGTAPYTITIAGDLADEDQTELPDLIVYNEDLTGTTGFTVNIESVQEATGPNHWNDPLNWKNIATGANGLPADGDDVLIDLADDSRSILYGLEQSGVTLNSIKITNAFEGRIGLPNWNENGYHEYRPTELEIGLDPSGDKEIKIGTGVQGSGSGLIKINTGSTEVHLRIFSTNGPEVDQPRAVMWRGTHASNTLEMISGSFAAGPFNGDAYTLTTITQRDGDILLGSGGSVDDIDSTGGALYADDIAISGRFAFRGQ